jgi:hypothetical protein
MSIVLVSLLLLPLLIAFLSILTADRGRAHNAEAGKL